MGAKVSSGDGDSKGFSQNAEPNVIPFVDVMLVLLIIFMVASPIASVDINVDLPNAKVLPSKRPPKPTYVTVEHNGGQPRFYVGNDQAIDTEQLGEMTFKEVMKNDKKAKTEIDVIETRVYVRADAQTPYRNVVFAMNRLQDRGFFKVALVAADKRR